MSTLRAPVAADAATATVHPPHALAVNRGQAFDLADGAASVHRLLAEGSYVSAPVPSAVAYRMDWRDHRQTGLVAEVPAAAYADGRIRGHEATHPDRERRIAEATRATGIESVPVTLTHAPSEPLRALLAEVTAAAPVARTAAGSEVVHTAWIGPDADLVARIYEQLAGLGTLYVADGHHRLAAARDYARGHAGGPSARTLAALFPTDEMRILGYHRCVTRPPGMSPSDLRDALARQPVTARVRECGAAEDALPAPGVVTVYLRGRWLRVELRAPAEPGTVRDTLDVVAVDEGILAPVFGIADVQAHADATAVAGGGAPGDIARWCDEHDAIGFLPHPPTVEQVLAVSDAGLLMPPKSTWFAPKARPGLFVRQLSQGAQARAASAR